MKIPTQGTHHYQNFKIRRKEPVWLRYDQTYAYNLYQRTSLSLMAQVQTPSRNSRFRWRDLFDVDIKFDEKRNTKPEYMYNEILPPVIEKWKILEANKRSFY